MEPQLASLHPPWKTGRSAGARGVTRACRCVFEAAHEAIKKAAECMRDCAAPWLAQLKAIELIRDRAWGTNGSARAARGGHRQLGHYHVVGPDGREWNGAGASPDIAAANSPNIRELEMVSQRLPVPARRAVLEVEQKIPAPAVQ
jgi:hypothetical protein